MTDSDTFPRQKARTRGFQLGRPRTFTVAGNRLSFIRSSSGSDPFGCLWQVDTTRLGEADNAERCLVDGPSLLAASAASAASADLPGTDGQLPPAERARRERMREVSAGVTAYDVDDTGHRIVLAVDGVLYAVDATDVDDARITALATPGPVVDPRIDPTGRHVAYVVDGEMWCGSTDGSPPTRLCARTREHQTWGLADFIAAEELDRHRGHWWLPDGRTLLVEEVDEQPVDTWWISDPSQPSAAPHPHRYPAAGTTNASVALWLVTPDGTATPVPWDHEAYEYLATVRVDGPVPVVEVVSRDQRSSAIATIAPGFTPIGRRTDAHWVDVQAGVPRLLADGRTLLTIEHDASTDTFRLRGPAGWLSPAGLQVTALLSADEHGLVFLASPTPAHQGCYRLPHDPTAHPKADPSGAHTAFTELAELSPPDGWTTGMAHDGIVVLATSSIDSCQPTYVVHSLSTGAHATLANHGEAPLIDVRPQLLRVGSRALASCLLLPTGHRGGSLPVICSPYGGPHGQRVMQAAGAFTTEQWLADQGFAVVVVDGRGTPGRGPAWERAIDEDWSQVVVQDQVDALLAIAATHPDLDLGRVGIRGWSFGGYLAALAVLDRPDVFHAAVAGAPVTEWRLYDTAYTERYLGHPSEHAARYDAASLLPRASALRRPLLIIHGLADDNVHVANTLQLSSALLAAGRAHSVVPLSRVTHMTPQEDVAENLLRVEVEFFHRALGEPPAH